jgi:hypothetical protein
MQNFEIKAGYINYRTSFITYDMSGYVTSDCNSMVFINYGTNPVSIESVVLNQGQSLVIEGNVGEYTTQRFFARFTGSGTNNLVTVKKNYL